MNFRGLLFIACIVFVVKGASLPDYPENSFFTVKQDPKSGVWWFVDPNGELFWSKGIDAWSPYGDPDRVTGKSDYTTSVTNKYGQDLEKWGDDQVQRALRWGINTLGAWQSRILEDKKLPYTNIIGFYAKWKGYLNNNVNVVSTYTPDLYHPGFPEFCRNLVREQVLPYIHDQYLMGWFLENEVHLGANWHRSTTIFAEYLNFTKDSPAWKATNAYARELYGTVAKLNKAWQIKITSFDDLHLIRPAGPTYYADSVNFDQRTAKLYFDTVTGILRAADPNHLILGVRWNGMPNTKSLAVDSSDVLSMNFYRAPRNASTYPEFVSINSIQNKALLIGEFNYKANDTGHPNTRGGGILTANQTVRADYYKYWMGNVSAMPFIVGSHWFRFSDQPLNGRFDGENSNTGVVDLNDNEYPLLAAAMSESNPTLDALHGPAVQFDAQYGPRTPCNSTESCSNNGYCYPPTGRCYCNKFYGGGDCSYLIGQISDDFTTVDTNKWDVSTVSNFNWWTNLRRDAMVANEDGLTMNLVRLDQGVNMTCPGKSWSGVGLISAHSFNNGWVNFSYKASPLSSPKFALRWLVNDKYDLRYSVLYGLDSTIRVYSDDVLIMTANAPVPKIGLGYFYLYYYVGNTIYCPINQTQAYLKDFVYEAVIADCPNSCSNHGICDYETTTCMCDATYTGSDCSVKANGPPSIGFLRNADNNNFVNIVNGILSSSSSDIATATLFSIKDDKYNAYSIQNTATGLYATATNYGTKPMKIDRPTNSAWESFAFENTTNGWAIKADINKKYVAVQPITLQLQPTASVPTTTSLFNIITPLTNSTFNLTPSIKVRLLSKFNNKFLTVSANYLMATEASITDGTVFNLVQQSSSGRWVLQHTSTFKYASADRNIKNYPVVVNRATTSTWEQFTFQAQDDFAFSILAQSTLQYFTVQTSGSIYSTGVSATDSSSLFYIIPA